MSRQRGALSWEGGSFCTVPEVKCQWLYVSQDTPIIPDELPSQPDIPPPQIPSLAGPSNLGSAHPGEEHVRFAS